MPKPAHLRTHFGRQLAVVLTACPLALGLARPALADETMVQLATGGDWMALAHRPSMVAAPDVCLAVYQSSSGNNIALRIDNHDVEFRVGNEDWSLPSGVAGTIKVAVGTWYTFMDVAFNTNDRVDAMMSRDQLVGMVKVMDNAAAMMVTIGHAAPIPVSLNGSTKVTNALLTCAGIRNEAAPSGKNPFE
jgi:hypothetical protein